MQVIDVVYLDNTILTQSAQMYAYLKQQGRSTGEFDLLIAATALVKQMTLITNNERHYQFLQESFDLSMENWMK